MWNTEAVKCVPVIHSEHKRFHTVNASAVAICSRWPFAQIGLTFKLTASTV